MELNARGTGIKRIIRGSYRGLGEVTIPAVDRNKSVIILQTSAAGSFGSGYTVYGAYVNFKNNTTLTIDARVVAGTATRDINLIYQVIEYSF
uniref:Uncharacterized protein n=1 Tax=Aliivibrio wodanis TaxID=80852 RepID=A0A5Q4ZX95_9GAMM|nr:hypothetical protein AW0309160_01826 [Aliivibrio wodanis]